MINLGIINIGDIYCITLKSRKDKRRKMNKHLKKKKLTRVKYFYANLHKNPQRGCLESHVSIIKEAKRRNLPNVLILEDDARIKTKQLFFNSMLTPPEDWDFLYLGGNVQQILNGSGGSYWKRISCLTTHAYIVRNTMYDFILKNAPKTKKAIDVFYAQDVHFDNNAYILTEPMVIQEAGYSDIQNEFKDYNHLLHKNLSENLPDELKICNHTIDNESYILKTIDIPDDNLPTVSIITPTRNRQNIFPLAIRNFYKFIYPRNKIEWIIIDDSDCYDTSKNILLECIPESDKRIRHVVIDLKGKSPLTISKKRNIGCMYASNKIIVHMDDDDYYFPESVIARVKVLVSNPNENIVGCNKIGTYDLTSNNSAFSYDKDINGNLTKLCEATMAYYKSTWIQRNFDENVERSEGVSFIHGRYKEVVTIPYFYVLIAFTHNKNITGNLRKITENNEGSDNFFDFFDKETQEFIHCLKETL